MALDVASLFVKIAADTTNLENGLNKAKSSTEGFVGVIKKIGTALAAAFAVREIAKFTTEVVTLASDMNETLTKSNVVFGEQADALIKWADSAALSMGMSKSEALSAAATYGNFFRSMGLASDVSAVMAQNLVKLASDLASFNNIDPSVALDKLRAGLAGEVEPLRALGVNLTAATIEAKAMEMGIMRAGDEITAATRAQASYALILEQTATAQGDFARTSDGLANQQRILKATWTDLRTTLGDAFLPLATTLTTALSASANAVGPALENISQQIRTWSINLIANMFYWGANMVQSLANGIVGSSAVVDALNQLGSYFSMMLEAHSPPKLLPDLEKWGAGAAQAYIDGWVGATPTSKGILDKWGAALKPMLTAITGGGSYNDEMGKQLNKQFGDSGAVLAEYVSSFSDLKDATKGVTDAQKEYDDIAETGDAEQIKNAKDKLDKAKDSESQAKARYSLARSRMRAEAESQAQLVKATRLQTEAIKEQGAVLKDQAAAQVAASQKAIDNARLAWQMAQTDTKGKIALLEEESKKYDQNSVEWYQLQTQKINLEKQLQAEQEKTAGGAGGGGMVKSIAADLSQIKGLGDLVGGIKSNLVDIGNGLLIDPLTMQIQTPPPNLFTLIQKLGRAMGGNFIKDFLDIMWTRLNESLGLDPDAKIGESVKTLGQKMGDALGTAIYDAIMERVKQSWEESWDFLNRNVGEGPSHTPHLGGPTTPSVSPGTYNPYQPNLDFGLSGAMSTASSNGSTYNINIQTNDQGTIRKLRELGVAV